VVMPVHVVQDTLADDEEARLAPLVASYLERGHGPITISAGSQDLRAGVPESLRRMRERLLAAGVPASAIRVLITEQGSDAVTVSYERYEVAVPICGDWSGPAVYDPYNDVSSNFGCAMQRNVGLMVADPADLVHKRDSSPSDAANSDRVVQRYRAGQPPGGVPNPQQLLGASGFSPR